MEVLFNSVIYYSIPLYSFYTIVDKNLCVYCIYVWACNHCGASSTFRSAGCCHRTSVQSPSMGPRGLLTVVHYIKQYDLMHWIDSSVFPNQPLHVISDPNHILIIHHLSILTVCSGILVIFTLAKCCQVAFSLHFPWGQKYSEMLSVVPHTLRTSPKSNSPLFQPPFAHLPIPYSNPV